MEIFVYYICLIACIAGIVAIAQRSPQFRWIALPICSLAAIGMIYFLWNVSSPPDSDLYGDFQDAYYPAGWQILSVPEWLYKYPEQGLAFVNLPILALLSTPFPSLGLVVSEGVFLAGGLVAVVLTCWLTIRWTQVSGWRRLLLIGLFVVNGPMYYSIRMGNTTHFVLLILLIALLYLRQRHEIWAGSLLAIASLIKLPLLLVGIYFAARQRWQIFKGFWMTLVFVSGMSLLLFGLRLHWHWFQRSILAFSGKTLTAFNAQSVSSFLMRLLIGGDIHSWKPIKVSLSFGLLSHGLTFLLVSAVILVFWKSKPPTTLKEENTEISIVLCLTLVISSVSWTHYYLLLLIPLIFYLSREISFPTGRRWLGLLILSALLISLPTLEFRDMNESILSLLISRFLISYYVLGGILLMLTLLAGRWYTAKDCPKRLLPNNLW